MDSSADHPPSAVSSEEIQTVPLWPGAELTPVDDAAGPALGSVLRSRYVLDEAIGRGGNSLIFRATDLHRCEPEAAGSQTVAIKMLRPERRREPCALALLKREFQQMQRLSHPGIARVFDLDCDGGLWFLSMEYFPGSSLKRWVENSPGQPGALALIAGCCAALEYAHSMGVLHGDLTPTNVLVGADRGIKLIDFGAAPGRGTAPADSVLELTPQYASPQVLAGEHPDARDDVFSLACLSYFILSGGRHPFGGHPSLEHGRVKSAPDRVRDIPDDVFAIIVRGLSGERNDRPATPAAFLRELDGAAKGRSQLSGLVLPPPSAATVRTTQRRDAADVMFSRALQVIAACALAGWVFLYPRTPSAPQTPAAAAPVAEPPALHAAELPPPQAAAPAAPRREASSGVISFDAPIVRVSSLQSLVAIPVRRPAGLRGRAEFRWRIEGGTAQPDIDYQRTPPQLVKFIEGQAVRMLYVPLVAKQATNAGRISRTFSVVLEQVAGGPALGRFARVTVAIDPPGMTPPARLTVRNEPGWSPALDQD